MFGWMSWEDDLGVDKINMKILLPGLCEWEDLSISFRFLI